MNATQLAQFEEKLQNAGYKKYTSSLSSREAYGWFKSKKTQMGDDYVREWTIEYRVWDYTEYSHVQTEFNNNPYSIDLLILDGNSSERIDVEFTSPVPDIDQAEQFADNFHKLVISSKLKSIK